MFKTAKSFLPLIILLLVSSSSSETISQNLLDGVTSLLPGIFKLQRAFIHLRDDHSRWNDFDFIIVGAGPAASALSYRLSEVKGWDILILEAGGEEVPIMDIPYLLGQFQSTDANWHYVTTPQDTVCIALEDSECDYPQGRTVGGSTTINYMFNIRGNKRDFDNWAEMGNDGWSFDDVLPYFKKVEDLRIPELKDEENRGYDGRIITTYPNYFSKMAKLMMRAANETGIPMPKDYNNGPQTGFSRIQTTTYRGERYSANRGYMRETRNRRNVFLRPRSYVTELLMDGPRVRGVRYIHKNRTYEAYAKNEVILSAGAVNSPALLMRSGIGPKKHLEELGIPLVQDLPVGHNLMDHAGFIAIVELNKNVVPSVTNTVLNPLNSIAYSTLKRGPFTGTGPFELVTFTDLDGTPYHNPGWPEVEIVHSSVNPAPTAKSGRIFRLRNDNYTKILYSKTPTFVSILWRLRSKSRGRISLQNKDPLTPPLIDPNSFKEKEDIEVVLAALREYQKYLEAPSLQRIGARLYSEPVIGCESFEFDSDDYWRCAITHFSLTIWHPTGTCKMAPPGDPTGVVTPDLKVVGIENLRVIDSSICPLIPSGHLQITSYMIGEKMSDVIKQEYGV